MWEQIAVRIIVGLILKKLPKSSDSRKQVLAHNVLITPTIKNFVDILENKEVEDIVIEMGINVGSTVLQVGEWLKGLGKK